jgi:hypothetical protein
MIRRGKRGEEKEARGTLICDADFPMVR